MLMVFTVALFTFNFIYMYFNQSLPRRTKAMGFKVRAIILSSVMVFGLAYYAMPRFPDTVNNPGLKSFTGIVFGGIHLLVSEVKSFMALIISKFNPTSLLKLCLSILST